MGMPEAVIEHLRDEAEKGRRDAPPGLEEHFARTRATQAYLEMREVRSDLVRLGLLKNNEVEDATGKYE